MSLADCRGPTPRARPRHAGKRWIEDHAVRERLLLALSLAACLAVTAGAVGGA